MGRGKNKGLQRAGCQSKAQRARLWRQVLRQAEVQVAREAAQRKATVAASISASSRRDRCRVQREFLRQLLLGPREGPCSSESEVGEGVSVRRPCRPPPPLPPVPVDQYRLLLGKEEMEEEEEAREAAVGQTRVVPSLMELCCRQMAQDFLIYGLLEKKEQSPAPPGLADAQGETQDEVEGEGYGEEDEEEVPLREVMSLLPVRVVERIAFLASRMHTITDQNLPFLCHPTIESLVLIGDFTDRGLARSLFPHQNPSVVLSWDEDDLLEDVSAAKMFSGCLALESLRLHSERITPKVIVQLTRALPRIKRLALPYCFNRMMTVSEAQVLEEGVAWLLKLVELDLVGCNWVSERGLVSYLETIAHQKRQLHLTTLRVPAQAVGPSLREALTRLRPQVSLVVVGPSTELTFRSP